MTSTVEKSKMRTSLRRFGAGALVGAAGAALFLGFAGGRYIDLADPVAMLTAGTGLVYALMGLAVGFGILAPRTGARFLNVEDADELRDERPKLQVGAATCVLIGIFFLVLALSASGQALNAFAVLLIGAACLVGTVILTMIGRARTDELTRQINFEASSFTLNTAFVVLAAWAALAQLGYVEWVSPLVLISSLAMLQLVSIMATSAAKGLLVR
jgi:hypothetical protein